VLDVLCSESKKPIAATKTNTMIEETKVQKEVVERRKICDVCGNEITSTMACSRAVCEYCGKDLCENCIGHEDSTYGDYRTVYCKRCWEIGERYRPQIEALDERRDKLYESWRDECKHPIEPTDEPATKEYTMKRRWNHDEHNNTRRHDTQHRYNATCFLLSMWT